jgi:hypothetical protein
VKKLNSVFDPVKYHHKNLCLDHVGLAGTFTICPETTSIYGFDTFHPLPSKVTLLPIAHCA